MTSRMFAATLAITIALAAAAPATAKPHHVSGAFASPVSNKELGDIRGAGLDQYDSLSQLAALAEHLPANNINITKTTIQGSVVNSHIVSK